METFDLIQQMIANLLAVPGVESVDVGINEGNIKIKILETHARATDSITIARTITETIPKGRGFKTVGDRAITYRGETVYWSWLIKEGPKVKVVCALCGTELRKEPYSEFCDNCWELSEALQKLNVRCPNGKTKVLYELGLIEVDALEAAVQFMGKCAQAVSVWFDSSWGNFTEILEKHLKGAKDETTKGSSRENE